MTFKLNEEIKKINKTLQNYGFSKFKTEAKEVERNVNIEGVGQGHWDKQFATWQDYLKDTPNAYDVARGTYTEEEEFGHRVGSVYNAFAVVVTEWFYNKISTEANQAKKKELWNIFCEIRNVLNVPSAEAVYGNDDPGEKGSDDVLRSWSKSPDKGKNPFLYEISFDDAIKWMKTEATKVVDKDEKDEEINGEDDDGESNAENDEKEEEDKKLSPLQIKIKYLVRHIENRLKLYPCEEEFNAAGVKERVKGKGKESAEGEEEEMESYFPNGITEWRDVLVAIDNIDYKEFKNEDEAKAKKLTSFRECEPRVLRALTDATLNYLMNEERQPDISKRFEEIVEYLNLYIKRGEYSSSRNGEEETYWERKSEIDELERKLPNSWTYDRIADRYSHSIEEASIPTTKWNPIGEISSEDIKPSLRRIVEVLVNFREDAQKKIDGEKAYGDGEGQEGTEKWLRDLESVIVYLSKKIA